MVKTMAFVQICSPHQFEIMGMAAKDKFYFMFMHEVDQHCSVFLMGIHQYPGSSNVSAIE